MYGARMCIEPTAAHAGKSRGAEPQGWTWQTHKCRLRADYNKIYLHLGNRCQVLLGRPRLSQPLLGQQAAEDGTVAEKPHASLGGELSHALPRPLV